MTYIAYVLKVLKINVCPLYVLHPKIRGCVICSWLVGSVLMPQFSLSYRSVVQLSSFLSPTSIYTYVLHVLPNLPV